MKYKLLSIEEMQSHRVGEAITVTTVMALITIAVMAVVIYRLFRSSKGGVTVPGGWKFSWNG
ncbi:MAG TPA: hypothetical protein GX010_00830 [Erysipelotrichaceae bacterium]|nr:hypothetical protein [Erysipelotrichaceae bacterium]